MRVNQPRLVEKDGAEIEGLVEQMTLAEKIGQMTQVEKNSITPNDVTRYFIGSVLSGGGGNPEKNTPENWAKMVGTFQEAALKTRLGIPLIYGSDAVHGHNNVQGAVIFPHNIGLGATRDADLIERIAHVTAKEILATNVHWDFAPAVSVPQDIRWGRTYEGYSQDTGIVTELGAAFVRGMQNGSPRALASVKHYAADGGTQWGTTQRYEWLHGNWQTPGSTYNIDQGDADIDEATLRAIHLAPYKAAIEAGAQNIMVSFSSWQGLKMHAHHYLLTDVLKGEFGFNGFLVSDWSAVSMIDRDYYLSVVTSINAGLDMVMVPVDYKLFINTLTKAVEAGEVSMERIDDAVRRILRVKAWLGMFEAPFGREDLLPEVGSEAHRAVAREAVRKSLVLLKNENNLLPLAKNELILVAGKGADDIGMQCGGWSISWQGDHGSITTGTSILTGIRKTLKDEAELAYDPHGEFAGAERAPIGVVFIGESPYSEGMGDNAEVSVSAEDLALIGRMRARCSKLVVVLLSGRPLILGDALTQADALVAAWLPGTEAQGIADVLFGDYPFTGKLSFWWPRSIDQVPVTALQASSEPPQFPLGYGLTT
ncbi:MAG: glycoside hydrolase family 3 C-terminal domain-containing protein [Anaerolineae bacterium]|nr:glycoside hydrolase family 3 C-terminal domain-containing protein [Anaerolineae bacterium]